MIWCVICTGIDSPLAFCAPRGGRTCLNLPTERRLRTPCNDCIFKFMVQKCVPQSGDPFRVKLLTDASHKRGRWRAHQKTAVRSRLARGGGRFMFDMLLHIQRIQYPARELPQRSRRSCQRSVGRALLVTVAFPTLWYRNAFPERRLVSNKAAGGRTARAPSRASAS